MERDTKLLDDIYISALNHYDYCPKRAWYIFVCGEFMENIHTIEGLLLHERSDSAEKTMRGDLIQIRTVRLYSQKYGLVGVADLVEEANGKIYPVEYKKGRKGDWKNDQLQLCAQALCLEEMLSLAQPIEKGYIYYAATGRRKEVSLTEELRAYTVKTIDAVGKLLENRKRPEVNYNPRCRGCSLYPICLPKEVQMLKSSSW